MTITLELRPEIEARVEAAAEAKGLPVSEFLQTLIAESLAKSSMTGAEALAYWKQEGVLGLFADRPDSPEFARELRSAAEERS